MLLQNLKIQLQHFLKIFLKLLFLKKIPFYDTPRRHTETTHRDDTPTRHTDTTHLHIHMHS